MILYEREVVLLVHSGSRGYGGHILQPCTKDGRESIREDDPIPWQNLTSKNTTVPALGRRGIEIE